MPDETVFKGQNNLQVDFNSPNIAYSLIINLIVYLTKLLRIKRYP